MLLISRGQKTCVVFRAVGESRPLITQLHTSFCIGRCLVYPRRQRPGKLDPFRQGTIMALSLRPITCQASRTSRKNLALFPVIENES